MTDPGRLDGVLRLALFGVTLSHVLACAPDAATAPDATTTPTDYAVRWSTDPAPPRAREEARFSATLTDQDGTPIEDLQRSHARMLHTLFLSADLRDFLHLHQEDFAPVTAVDLRAGTFAFPVTFPSAGEWTLAFDFAHRDQYVARADTLLVGGSPAQDAPDVTPTDTSTSDGVTGTIRFATLPAAGLRTDWTITLEDAAGVPVADVVPWLDADAHAVLASADLAWVTHTHAWFPGMEAMAPGHAMPHLYDGPEFPFQAVFEVPGPNVVWVQFARVDAPDSPVTLRFVVEVTP
jgi:hypothetical protein